MPPIIERPIADKRYCGREENYNRSHHILFPKRHCLGESELDQPTDAEPGGNRDRNKRWQIVRILVLRNFVAESVSQIGNDDKQQKPESCAVFFESGSETPRRQDQGQLEPRLAEFTQGHSAKFNK